MYFYEDQVTQSIRKCTGTEDNDQTDIYKKQEGSAGV